MKLSPGSRLVVIYLLTIVFAGSILTYLGLSNISNFRELTEKEVLEEESILADEYRYKLDSLLTACVEVLIMQQALGEREIPCKPLKTLVADASGKIVEPPITEVFGQPSSGRDNPVFANAFRLAESREFKRHEYTIAHDSYLKALMLARSQADSMKTFNAMGRCALLSGDTSSAVSYYRTMIQEGPMAANVVGVPYSYFAMSQLITLDRARWGQCVDTVLRAFLNSVVEGITPIAPSLDQLLVDIDTGLDTSDEDFNAEFHSLSDDVRRTIAYIDTYKDAISGFHERYINGVTIDSSVNRIIGDTIVPGELILGVSRDRNVEWHIISTQQLHERLLAEIDLRPSRFQYKMALEEKETDEALFSTGLPMRFSLAPRVVHQELKISLAEPNDLKSFLLRRKAFNILGLAMLLGTFGIGLILLYRDVTRSRKTDQLRREFVSSVTHELKTPLTSINMLAESINTGRVKSETRLNQYSESILKESERLKRMVNNILEFSRTEDGQLRYVLVPNNLSEVIRKVVSELRYWLDANEFQYSEELDERLEAICDKEALEQVLSNLIVNAIKYSRDERSLHIRAYEQGNWAVIEVTDSGIGILASDQEYIFNKFYRSKAAEESSVSGTGLGLTVSKSMVNAMNGTITVRSTPGKGSTFSIILHSVQHGK